MVEAAAEVVVADYLVVITAVAGVRAAEAAELGVPAVEAVADRAVAAVADRPVFTSTLPPRLKFIRRKFLQRQPRRVSALATP